MNGDRRRILLLSLILFAGCALVTSTSIWILYQAALEGEKTRLGVSAQSQARLIEAVARFDAAFSVDYPGGHIAATIDQVIDAHEHYRGFGKTGEFTIARREGDFIVFLFRHGHDQVDVPGSIPFTSDLAEPMRRALNGLSGAVIGLDYRGATVLAAHEPINELNLGIVAKIDLAEIRAPFTRAAQSAALIAVAAVMIGVILVIRVGKPVINRLEAHAEILKKEIEERKLAEDSLRRSEEKYRSLFEHASDSIFIVDPTTRGLVDVNENAATRLGYTREELLQMTIDDIDTPLAASRNEAIIKELQEKGSIVFDHEHRRKDGTKMKVEISSREVEFDGRKVFESLARDISERKAAEKKLRESEERLRLSNELFENTIESLPHPFYVIDANDYRVMIANEAATVYGSVTEDTTCYALTHNRTRPCRGLNRTCPLKEVKRTRETTTVEHVHYDKDRNSRVIEVTGFPVFDDEDNVVQVLVLSVDITKRRLAEQELQESERRFHAVADSAHDAIVTIDSNGRITFWNKAAETVLGYTADEIVGEPVSMIMPARFREEHRNGLNRAISTGELRIVGNTVEVTGLRKDGCECPLELSLAKWEATGKIFFTGILRDIAERKRAAAELQTASRRMRNDLEAAARIQKSLLPRECFEIHGVKFASAFQPCDELGGDILNVFQLDETHVGLYILDVSGHGVQAALLSVALSHLMSPRPGQSSLLIRRSTSAPGHRIVPPAKVAEHLNRQFLMDPEEPQYFTLVYGILNVETHDFRYVSAGHPGLIHLSQDSGAAVLENRGCPIGCFKDANHEECTVSLEPGDRLYLYSDGITEAVNSKEEEFDTQRLVSALEQSRDLALEDSIKSLMGSVREWCGDARPGDDISILAVELAEVSNRSRH
jgi:PAS domain S-box-containing protein